MQFNRFDVVLVVLTISMGFCKRMRQLNADCQGLTEVFTWSNISYVISKIDYDSLVRQDQLWRNQQTQTQSKTKTYNNKPVVVISDNNEALNYIHQNNIPMGVNRWRNKLFITVPRRYDGVLSTFNYVPMHSIGQHNVPLIPYPDFETNRQVEPADPNVNRFVSVYRVAVDVCDRLWIADTGAIQIIGNIRRIQPPTVYIMDLHTDKIIRKYQFKDTDIADKNGIFSITVDTTIRTCNDAYAYLPDTRGTGIVVYSFKTDASWRFEHDSFRPEPNQSGFMIGVIPIMFQDGIFSISLSKVKRDGFRDAYYQPMIGISLYKVSTKILRDKILAGRHDGDDDFKLVGVREEGSQTSSSTLHEKTGLMFFGLLAQNAVGCWNSNYPFEAEDFDIVDRDDEKLIYPSDLKIYKDDIIVMSNKFAIFVYSKLNYEETNFRVFMSSVYDATKNTKCAKKL